MRHEHGIGRLGPLVGIVAAAGLLATLTLFLRVGPTTSGPDRTVLPPDLAATSSTTTTVSSAPTTTPPESTTSTTPIPPSLPPEPTVVETALGTMEWAYHELAAVTRFDHFTSSPAIRPDGAVVLIVADEEGFDLLESVDGDEWTVTPVTGIAPGHAPWQLAVVGDMLLTAAWSPGGPTVWHETLRGAFVPSELEMPDTGVDWLVPRWQVPVIVPGADGVELFGSYRGFALDWPTLLGVPPTPEEYWSWHPDTELLVLSGEGGTATEVRYRATVTVDGERLAVVIRDVDTGAVVTDVFAETPLADQIRASLDWGDHEIDFGSTTHVRWHSRDGTSFALVPGEPLQADNRSYVQGFAAVGDRYLLIEIGWDEEAQLPLSRLLASQGAGPWEDIFSRLSVQPLELRSMAAHGDTVAILGVRHGRYQISDQVSATGALSEVYVTTDLRDWTSVQVGAPGPSSSLDHIWSGPLGWIMSGNDCRVECRMVPWVSADALTWSEVTLPVSRFWSEGWAVVGADKIVLAGYSGFEGTKRGVIVGRLIDP